MQAGSRTVARLEFVGKGYHAPGWYIRYVDEGRPVSVRLPVEVGADAFGAVESAAKYLSCEPDQIAVYGTVWPEPLDGMVDAEGTLEYVADRMPGPTDRRGEWRKFARDRHQNDNQIPQYQEPRRFERKLVHGIHLYLPVRGRIVNLSDGGIGIEAYRPLRVATRAIFEAQGTSSRMELYGEVRWCYLVDGLPLDSPALYRAGITLIA
jgi:hypothetical protein